MIRKCVLLTDCDKLEINVRSQNNKQGLETGSQS